MRNVGKHTSWMMITSSRTKSFTQDRHQLQLHISLHPSLPHPHSWPVSSNHPTNYSSSLTPTITPQRVNGALFALLLRPALLYPHHASRTAASLWNSSPFIMTTSGTTPSISIFGCNTMQPAILQPLLHMLQPTSSNLSILPKPMLSITVWSHFAAGSISHTATHSSTDLLILPSFRPAKHVGSSLVEVQLWQHWQHIRKRGGSVVALAEATQRWWQQRGIGGGGGSNGSAAGSATVVGEGRDVLEKALYSKVGPAAEWTGCFYHFHMLQSRSPKIKTHDHVLIFCCRNLSHSHLSKIFANFSALRGRQQNNP